MLWQKILQPCRIDKADGNEIQQVQLILTTERIQFHSDKCFEPDDVIVFGVLDF